MAKTKRGKPLRSQTGGRNRGTCPLCARTGVKLLTESKSADGKTILVCKACTKVAAKQAKAAEAEAAAAKAAAEAKAAPAEEAAEDGSDADA